MADIISKANDTAIKITSTTEKVVTLQSLKVQEAMLTNSLNATQNRLNIVKDQIAQAEALGVVEAVAEIGDSWL